MRKLYLIFKNLLQWLFLFIYYSRVINAPPPIFTTELKNASVKIGDTVLLGCQGNELLIIFLFN